MNKEQQREIEFQLLNQHLQQLNEQLNTLRMQLSDLRSIKDGLNDLKSLKNKKAVVPLGAGVFLESEIKSVKDVLLNIGSNVIIKKDLESAQKILENQVNDLEKIAIQIETNISKGVMQLHESED